MIVGVDISTHRIDLAWLEDGKPQRWHQELGSGSTIDRIRRIAVQWPASGLQEDPLWRGTFRLSPTPLAEDTTDVCIEEPWGRGKALAPLHQVLGIVTRQAPTWARVAHVSSLDLRRAIGAANTKLSAQTRMNYLAWCEDWDLADWDEHELDALVACIAWGRILEQQDAA